MNCTTFRENVLAYIDGELAAELQSAGAEHERVCADCAGSARGERAFEERSRAALLAAVPSGAFAQILAAAKARVERPAAGRVLPFGRAARSIASLAAVALVAVTAMWSLCVPPFECGYLQAVESAGTGESSATLPAPGAREGVPARFAPPARLLTFERVAEPEAVSVAYRGGARAVRADYAAGGERFTAVWSDLIGSCPSFRRHVERDGLEWWIAEENGRRIVTFICAKTDTLCALISTLPEERLRAIATEMRCD